MRPRVFRFPVFCFTLLLAFSGRPSQALEFDEVNLPESSLALVKADFAALQKLPIQAPGDSRFVRVFGGGDAQSVWQYLLERVQFVGAEIEDEEQVDATEDSGSESSITFASNYGPSFLQFLYEQRYQKKKKHRHPKAVTLPFRHTQVKVDSPRTGFVVLGKGYNPTDLGRLGRIETWVHEARHSDCASEIPGGAEGREQLRAYLNDEFAQLSQDTLGCTNLHVPCPKGHPLAGEEACDRHPWGAYMIGAVFAEGILKHCAHCSTKDKTEARELLKDNRSRFIGALKTAWDKDLLPPPVLTSIK